VLLSIVALCAFPYVIVVCVKVVDVALNLIYGGTVLNRINQLKYQGVQLPLSFTNIKGMPLDQLKGFAQ